MTRELLNIKLDGLPPTVNQMYRTGKYGTRYKRTEVQDWQEDTALKIKAAWKKEVYLIRHMSGLLKYSREGYVLSMKK